MFHLQILILSDNFWNLKLFFSRFFWLLLKFLLEMKDKVYFVLWNLIVVYSVFIWAPRIRRSEVSFYPLYFLLTSNKLGYSSEERQERIRVTVVWIICMKLKSCSQCLAISLFLRCEIPVVLSGGLWIVINNFHVHLFGKSILGALLFARCTMCSLHHIWSGCSVMTHCSWLAAKTCLWQVSAWT